MASGSPRAVSVRSKLIINSILAVAFVAISAPQATRISAHEWISLAFIGILALHLLFSWTWIVGVSARLMSALRGQVRFNYVLDAVSYLAMVAVIVSGIVISESALPALGFPRIHDRFWAVIHDRSSEFLLIVIGSHLAMHWEWIIAALRRLLSGSLARSVAHERRGSWTRPLLTLTAVSLVFAAAAIALGRTPFADGFRRAPGGERGRGEGGAGMVDEVGRDPSAAAANSAATTSASTALAATAVPASDSASAAGTVAASAVTAGADGDSVTASMRAGGAPGERRRAKGQRREQGERENGARTKGEREGGGNQLGWRQRYLRPAIKIGTFMGVPFLLTLVVSSLASRARPTGGRVAPADPLQQRID